MIANHAARMLLLFAPGSIARPSHPSSASNDSLALAPWTAPASNAPHLATIDKRQHHQEFCHDSLALCTQVQDDFMKRVHEAKGALEQLNDNLKTGAAYRESCNSQWKGNGELPQWTPIVNVTPPTPGLYHRQFDDLMHTFLPGWAIFTGISDVFVDITDKIHSAMLGPQPRNCTLTDICYHHLRQIKDGLSIQKVNVTNAATKLQELARKNAQCTRERVEDDLGGTIAPGGYFIPDPEPISVERRGSEEDLDSGSIERRGSKEEIYKELYVPVSLQSTRCITDNLNLGLVSVIYVYKSQARRLSLPITSCTFSETFKTTWRMAIQESNHNDLCVAQPESQNCCAVEINPRTLESCELPSPTVNSMSRAMARTLGNQTPMPRPCSWIN